MIINQNLRANVYNPLMQKIAQRQEFKNKIFYLEKDIFEYGNKAKSKVKDVVFSHFLCKEKELEKGVTETVKASLNTQNRATIYKKVKNPKTGKIEKQPYEVYVAESSNDWQTTYHFLDKDKQTELGYVVIDDWAKAEKNTNLLKYYGDSALLDNYPELGIIGDRISIDYLQNNFEDLYGGIGKIADQAAIEYCLKNRMKPNITSVADYNSHSAHYQRGRRFFEISKYDKDIDAYEFRDAYGTLNPNKIIEERISQTPKGEKVDTKDLCGLYMYMPQNLINSYLRIIEKNPIFRAKPTTTLLQ